ncbi:MULTISPECIES: hypothetical protein [unclassified Exiguobacterium]|uniref:hypothetical protein n=1 Tax=unclassified Exiguobacterium TaxID=2644629 RepID=UPI001BEB024F|nr:MULTISPECIES: hypothetical protein [unclassified Exiguobacterium]
MLTHKQLEQLYIEHGLELEDGTEYTVIEKGDWVSEHKSESMELIFTDGTKTYRGFIGRSGSYFTEYTYDSDIYGDDLADIDEVVKATKEVEYWKVV